MTQPDIVDPGQHQANPRLLIGELVDGVLITHLVEADPGVPRTADNLGPP
jgi:hypothetical protein